MPEQGNTTERETTQSDFPLLPLKDMVLFPDTRETALIGRSTSRSAVSTALQRDGRILVVTQKDPVVEHPGPDDLYQIGTLAYLSQVERPRDDLLSVELNGQKRARIIRFSATEGRVSLVPLEEKGLPDDSREYSVFMREIRRALAEVLQLDVDNLPPELEVLLQEKNGFPLLQALSQFTGLETTRRQELLAHDDMQERFYTLLSCLGNRDQVSHLDRAISQRVRRRLEASQKEFFLNEQLKEIRRELGQQADESADVDEFARRARTVKMSAEARKKFDKEMRRLTSIPVFSPEAGVIKGYLEWLLDLPWNVYSDEEQDLERVEQALNRSHFGLEDVKERILEFVAVQQLAGANGRGSILCLVGPPGTGKTTLGMSVANALGRHFVRMSLGGLKDEAEIRGHRRTYVGALPGRIIQNMKRAGSANPVFLLDEIDKLGMDYRGDPAAALLEVLDPEINHSFQDNYLEIEFDLSRVFFITTANALHSIPKPLQDRMEVVSISGYTEREKLVIGRRFVVPRQLKLAGLKTSHLKFTTPALRTIISDYTREAGVRNLEREIRTICRKTARRVLEGNTDTLRIDKDNMAQFLGQPRYHKPRKTPQPRIGLARGLAWTEAGGRVLDVEARCIPGRGRLYLTGKMGHTMRESAQAALSYARELSTRNTKSGIPFAERDVHVHIPEGAIPKDGPSAGITIAVSVLSTLFRAPVPATLAMSGEITLLGNVLPVGGLKEKILAAKRHGIRTLILPAENKRDVDELTPEITRGLTIHYLKNMDEVLGLALPGLGSKHGIRSEKSAQRSNDK